MKSEKGAETVEVKHHSIPTTTEEDFARCEQAVDEYSLEAKGLDFVMREYLQRLQYLKKKKGVVLGRKGKIQALIGQYSYAFQRLSAIKHRSEALLKLADERKKRTLGSRIEEKVKDMEALYLEHQKTLDEISKE